MTQRAPGPASAPEPSAAVGAGEGEPPREVGVGAALSHGWARLKTFLWPLVGLTALLWLLQLPLQVVNVPVDLLPATAVATVATAGLLYGVLVVIPLTYGMAWVAYRASTGERPAVADLFRGFRSYGAAVGSGLLVLVIVLVGLVLLIVPGLIFAWKLMFVPHLVVVEHLGPLDAVRTSWRRTRGHLGTLFLFWLASIGIVLVGAVLFLVGLLPATALLAVATAGLYRAISERAAGEGLDDIGTGTFENTARPAEGVGEG